MRGPLVLALAYCAHHRWRTAILVASLAAVLVLPVATHRLWGHYRRAMTARAAATPLVIGAKGSQQGLVLHALEHRHERVGAVPAGTWHALAAAGRGRVMPLHNRFTAHDVPVVGTTLDYLEFRGLRPGAGALPAVLGDAVAGAAAARRLGLAPGDFIVTDREELFDLSAVYPLRLRITGVLAPTGTADDGVLFVDVKTAWIVAGIGHGHADVDGDAALSDSTGVTVVAKPGIVEYAEIEPGNLGTFHFHGDPDTFPLTAIVVAPRGDKQRTLVLSSFVGHADLQCLEPPVVIGEVMDLVFRIKAVADIQTGLVITVMALLFGLIVALSLRLRRREMQTLHRLGCTRGTIGLMLGTEIGLVAAAAIVLGAAGGLGVARAVIAWGLL